MYPDVVVLVEAAVRLVELLDAVAELFGALFDGYLPEAQEAGATVSERVQVTRLIDACFEGYLADAALEAGVLVLPHP